MKRVDHLLLGVLLLSVLRSIQTRAEEAAPVAPKGPGGIVAIVGDEVITRAELDKKVERRRLQLMSRLPASVVDREIAWIAQDLLENMIDTKLLLQNARLEEKKGEGPYIGEADVDGEVARQVEEARKLGERVKGPEDLYRQAQEKEGIGRDEYRRNLREELTIRKFLWQKVYKASDDFVPPQELRSYYQSHIDDFSTPVEVAFRYLTIKYTRDERMHVLVERARQGIKDKQDFSELAKLIAELQGEDPAQAGIQFRVSFEDLKDWIKPTSEVLKSMKRGETSEPIPTANNDIRIFKVDDMKQGNPKTFEEVQELISKRLREETHRRQLDAFLQRQRRRTRLQNFLPPLERAPKEKDEARQDRARS